jgi:hypothetical protein
MSPAPRPARPTDAAQAPAMRTICTSSAVTGPPTGSPRPTP